MVNLTIDGRRISVPPGTTVLDAAKRLLNLNELGGREELLPALTPFFPNSRQRDFPLRLTFECFLWQMLKPRTACRRIW